MSGPEDLYSSVVMAVASACGLEPAAISPDTILEGIGFDSMALLYVVTQVGVEQGQAVPLEGALDLFEAKTVGALSDGLQRLVLAQLSVD